MSVINQMLKDLEDRAPEQNQSGSVPVSVPVKKSPVKLIVVIVFILVAINAVGLYIWQLTQENNVLKGQQLTRVENVADPKVIVSNSEEAIGDEIVNKQASEPKNSADTIKANKFTKRQQQPMAELHTSNNAEIELETVSKPNSLSTVATTNNNNTGESEVIVNPATKVIESTKKKAQNNNEVANANEQVTPEEILNAEKPKKASSMTVSRRQLTSQELIEQKLQQAEKLLATRNVAKAEELLQDILIIEPKHLEARKKLAALWYGRKAYNKAGNLLSQGIALAPKNKELRQMKAQILVKQQKFRLAYNVLEPLADIENEEYQVLLASVAQETGHLTMAIQSYQRLINMQPNVGRWYLGQAIVYDKDSQFNLAGQAYKLALARNDLTNASAQFAQQRLIALGQ
ncbi:lipopolysaccharide assembly protein LapB [Colwellia sp. RSH04]|uniref:tetratricopeptide repeat protein n=1 Tax=Colwellia sp. RSH04 TaxID=2305464 RepID=UPI000E574390|nr:tetratricopeptide repeat protein [Colwellia sp. RSH04]RHW76913.1 MSHA biogenesis protein MshN [Colwellia sp. RSH04]